MPRESLQQACRAPVVRINVALGLVHRPPRLAGSSPQYRCENRQGACPRPTITATLLDGTVWERAVSILRDPSVIEDEVAKRREDGGLDRDRAAIEKQIASIADKQGRIAKRLAEIEDDDVAALLMAELQALSTRKKTAEAERDDLMRRIADRAEEDARVRSLAQWCARVEANLDTMSYEEKRLALDALGVKVSVYKRGATDADGNSLPRWDITMRPAFDSVNVVYGSTRRCATPLIRPPASRSC
jgi:hypothetical protein